MLLNNGEIVRTKNCIQYDFKINKNTESINVTEFYSNMYELYRHLNKEDKNDMEPLYKLYMLIIEIIRKKYSEEKAPLRIIMNNYKVEGSYMDFVVSLVKEEKYKAIAYCKDIPLSLTTILNNIILENLDKTIEQLQEILNDFHKEIENISIEYINIESREEEDKDEFYSEIAMEED